MQLQVELPDDVAQALGANLPTSVLESIAAEGYRSGRLSESQVQRLLHLPTKFAVHEWLKKRQIPYNYSDEDLANDLTALSKTGIR